MIKLKTRDPSVIHTYTNIWSTNTAPGPVGISKSTIKQIHPVYVRMCADNLSQRLYNNETLNSVGTGPQVYTTVPTSNDVHGVYRTPRHIEALKINHW